MLAFKKTVHFLMFIVLIIISNDNIIKIRSLFFCEQNGISRGKVVDMQREKIVAAV